jgi:GcrA cell cycle regulator
MAFDAHDPQLLRAATAPARRRFNWNAERIALLERRWAEGASASTIARELGHLTRCAVLGKVHRLKLTQPAFKRLHPGKNALPGRRRAAQKPRARPQSQLMAAFEALGLAAVFGAQDLHSVEACAGKSFGRACSLLELGEATCRWPLGEPGEAGFAFCGAAPLSPYPYCPAHSLIAYRPQVAERGESALQRAPPVSHARGRRAA